MTALDVLFVHNNFPAQFRNLAESIARGPNVRVRAIGARHAPGLEGVELQRYGFSGDELATVHPFARRFEIECRRAEQVIYAAGALKLEGFSPKLIYVHPGWGEALPLRALFPEAAIGAYAEFYYWPRGTDVGFDREFDRFGIDGETRVVLRNAATLLSLADANFAVAPTHWQRSVFPPELQSKIHVVHDGLDTDRLSPESVAPATELDGRPLAEEDEIVTFVARNLEPYRGFHIFMRALPAILKARPKARICIVGGDSVSYGMPPAGFGSWRAFMLAELGSALPAERVHVLGTVPYRTYLALLRRSMAHVYLTYPFVLSWSMLEAMALECLVIGSDTAPVTEVIEDGRNGLLVPFFDAAALSERVIEALAEPERGRPLRRQARRTVVERYDFARVVLPAHQQLFDELGLPPALSHALKRAVAA